MSTQQATTEPGEAPLVVMSADELARIVGAAVRRATAHLAPPRVPFERAYSLAELGYRLRLGTDPALVEPCVLARTSPVSRQVIARLIGAPTGIGAEILARRIGGE